MKSKMRTGARGCDGGKRDSVMGKEISKTKGSNCDTSEVVMQINSKEKLP